MFVAPHSRRRFCLLEGLKNRIGTRARIYARVESQHRLCDDDAFDTSSLEGPVNRQNWPSYNVPREIRRAARATPNTFVFITAPPSAVVGRYGDVFTRRFVLLHTFGFRL